MLILYKKTTFQIQAEEYKDPRFLKLLEEKHESVTRVKLAHDEHMRTIEKLLSELDRRGIKHEDVARQDLNSPVSGVDMMISVGGDGTFLDASHCLQDVPLLGVNSSKSSSFGHFCAATEDNLVEILDAIQSGELPPSPILRLELVLNGQVLPDLVLNEVLVSHSNPAATSRYSLAIGENKEEQRSSGIWIGTPAGSTGSLRSAGGQVRPITEHTIQYFVREACMRPGEDWKNLTGLLPPDESIVVVSQMRTGTLYIDGPHIEHRFGLGDEVIVRSSPRHLMAFVDPKVNRMFSEACADGVARH